MKSYFLKSGTEIFVHEIEVSINFMKSNNLNYPSTPPFIIEIESTSRETPILE